MSSSSDMVNVPIIPGDGYWSNYVTGVKFGDTEEEEWLMESTYTFIDSGSSYITIPVAYYEWFISHLSGFVPSGFVAYSGNVKKMSNCDELSQLPSVSFLYGTYFFELNPVDYVLDLQAHNLGCIVMFTQDTGSNMILGVPFMKGFYIVHDLNNQSVGIVP